MFTKDQLKTMFYSAIAIMVCAIALGGVSAIIGTAIWGENYFQMCLTEYMIYPKLSFIVYPGFAMFGGAICEGLMFMGIEEIKEMNVRKHKN